MAGIQAPGSVRHIQQAGGYPSQTARCSGPINDLGNRSDAIDDRKGAPPPPPDLGDAFQFNDPSAMSEVSMEERKAFQDSRSPSLISGVSSNERRLLWSSEDPFETLPQIRPPVVGRDAPPAAHERQATGKVRRFNRWMRAGVDGLGERAEAMLRSFPGVRRQTTAVTLWTGEPEDGPEMTPVVVG